MKSSIYGIIYYQRFETFAKRLHISHRKSWDFCLYGNMWYVSHSTVLVLQTHTYIKTVSGWYTDVAMSINWFYPCIHRNNGVSIENKKKVSNGFFWTSW